MFKPESAEGHDIANVLCLVCCYYAWGVYRAKRGHLPIRACYYIPLQPYLQSITDALGFNFSKEFYCTQHS